MKCPWCSKPLNGAHSTCPGCGHAFSNLLSEKISTILRLKDNLAELQAIARRTSDSASSLTSQIAELEQQAANEARLAESTEAALLQATTSKHTEADPFDESLDDIGVWDGSPEDIEEPQPEEAEDIAVPEPEPVMAAVVPENKGTASDYINRANETLRKKRETASLSLETSLGKKWMPIIGVVTVIFGVGYFLKYAMDQGWVSPLQRVLSAYGWGAAFIVAGHFLKKRKYEGYGLIVMGGGLATWYFSTFASYHLYHLISQTPAFVLMFTITLAAGVLSVYYSNMWLAVLGLFGGYFTPLMLSTGANNYTFLFIYLAILGAGILGIAYYRRWPLLHYLGFIGTYVLYWLWYENHFIESPFWPAMTALSVYFLAYAFVPFSYRFFRADEAEGTDLARADVTMIVLNSFIAFAFSYSMITQRFTSEAVSLAAFFNASAFSAMAWFIYRKLRNRPAAFSIFASNAGLFVAVGVALLMADYWITFFWAIQAAGLFWAAMRTGDRGLLRTGAIFLMGLAFARVFYDYSAFFEFRMGQWAFVQDYTHEIISRAVLVLGVLGAFKAMALTLRKYGPGPEELTGGDESQHSIAIHWGFGLTLFFVLNAEVGGFFHQYLPHTKDAAISMIWALQAAVLMHRGVRATDAEGAGKRNLAIVLTGAVLIKALPFDYDSFGLVSGSLYFSTGYFHTLISRLMLAAVVLSSLRFMAHRVKGAGQGGTLADADRRVLGFLEWGFGIYVFTALNIEVSAFFHEFMPKAKAAAITMYWAAYAARLMHRGLRGRRPALETVLRRLGAALMAIVYIKAIFHDYGSMGLRDWTYFHAGYFDTIAARAVLAASVLAAMGFMAQRLTMKGLDGAHAPENQKYTSALKWGFGIYLFAVLNIETSAFFYDYLPKARFASISVLWTAFSAALMMLGFRQQAPVLRKLSIGLFMATLMKVFFLDISRIDTPYRILSFIVLGTVLVAVSYLYHRFHDRLSQALAVAPEEGRQGE